MLRRLPTRHALVAVAALIALVLVGSSVLRFVGARRAAAVVAMAEGDRLAFVVHQALGRSPPADREGALRQVIEDEGSLLYVALLEPDGRLRLEQGQAVGRPPSSPPGMPRLTASGVWMEVGLLPPGAPPRPPDAPPALRLFFDLGEAEPVLSAGYLDLGIGLVGGVGLLALAAGVWIADRRREQAERTAAAQQHLASLGEMSAVLAHEIRNPLAALKGHAQLLEERLRDTDGHASAERVVSGAVRLEQLVNDLLRFARSGTLQRSAVDPAEVAYDALTRVAPERIELLADQAPERFSLDPARMGQVLDNLLANAVQASPDGQQVELHVQAGPGRALTYIVRDHGEGVPADMRERLFEPFATSRTRGTGLGLAVAARLVRLHGGTLSVDDAPSGGARFTVLLPEVDPVSDPGR